VSAYSTKYTSPPRAASAPPSRVLSKFEINPDETRAARAHAGIIMRGEDKEMNTSTTSRLMTSRMSYGMEVRIRSGMLCPVCDCPVRCYPDETYPGFRIRCDGCGSDIVTYGIAP
jgi:hypothetical protein